MTRKLEDLINEMEEGSVRALARLITIVENREKGWLQVMKAIFPNTGKAHVLGITGPPGTGKSTLTDTLTCEFVGKGLSVGIIAVDPSSPFSGGSLLGDRVRMKEISTLKGVFIRSMATRGAMGGLSLAARDVVKVLDAFGKDIILIETVGVGQDEVEIVKTADAVMVVCVPGMGDNIQTIKAGIMEIADIFVVNKADFEGSDRAVLDIRLMLDMSTEKGSLKIPIVKTVATKGEGIPELVTNIFELLESQGRAPAWQEERVREELLSLVDKEIARHVHVKLGRNSKLDTAVKQVLARERDPYSIVQEMVASFVH
ncbi:MAG TPA: methylmalonyl Co-A mutase-associated GTPase MeaB [Deltaproteobacteria bacterium]|nr:methylmalonyl Co-A mutase-associated GTPase MeaB [Deltaproteobacteria bacterium]